MPTAWSGANRSRRKRTEAIGDERRTGRDNQSGPAGLDQAQAFEEQRVVGEHAGPDPSSSDQEDLPGELMRKPAFFDAGEALAAEPKPSQTAGTRY